MGKELLPVETSQFGKKMPVVNGLYVNYSELKRKSGLEAFKSLLRRTPEANYFIGKEENSANRFFDKEDKVELVFELEDGGYDIVELEQEGLRIESLGKSKEIGFSTADKTVVQIAMLRTTREQDPIEIRWERTSKGFDSYGRLHDGEPKKRTFLYKQVEPLVLEEARNLHSEYVDKTLVEIGEDLFKQKGMVDSYTS